MYISHHFYVFTLLYCGEMKNVNRALIAHEDCYLGKNEINFGRRVLELQRFFCRKKVSEKTQLKRRSGTHGLKNAFMVHKFIIR
jgi:hypothetical protein